MRLPQFLIRHPALLLTVITTVIAVPAAAAYGMAVWLVLS